MLYVPERRFRGGSGAGAKPGPFKFRTITRPLKKHLTRKQFGPTRRLLFSFDERTNEPGEHSARST